MPTYTFDEVAARAERTGKCPECGKRVKRSRTFTQTINPFNKNADGTVRSPGEVRAAVQREADGWQPTPWTLVHGPCEQQLTEEQVAAYLDQHRELEKAMREATR